MLRINGNLLLGEEEIEKRTKKSSDCQKNNDVPWSAWHGTKVTSGIEAANAIRRVASRACNASS